MHNKCKNSCQLAYLDIHDFFKIKFNDNGWFGINFVDNDILRSIRLANDKLLDQLKQQLD